MRANICKYLGICFAVLFFQNSMCLLGKTIDTTLQSNRILLGLQQIKESQNFGLVFTGVHASYAHTWQWEGENASSQLRSELGGGVLFSRAILGISLRCMPVEWLYYWNIAPSLYLGSIVAADYQYQLYPDLQSGASYWFSSWSAGVAARYSFHAFENDWNIAGSTSLLGFTSRPLTVRSPYFFDLGVGEAIRYLHQNIQFGSVNRFIRAQVEIAWKPQQNSSFRIAYTLSADTYFDTPQWTTLRQGIAITF